MNALPRNDMSADAFLAKDRLYASCGQQPSAAVILPRSLLVYMGRFVSHRA